MKNDYTLKERIIGNFMLSAIIGVIFLFSLYLLKVYGENAYYYAYTFWLITGCLTVMFTLFSEKRMK